MDNDQKPAEAQQQEAPSSTPQEVPSVTTSTNPVFVIAVITIVVLLVASGVAAFRNFHNESEPLLSVKTTEQVPTDEAPYVNPDLRDTPVPLATPTAPDQDASLSVSAESRSTPTRYIPPAWLTPLALANSKQYFPSQPIRYVATDAEDLSSDADFPAGFFNEYAPAKWGMINMNGGPVTVTIAFSTSTKLASIANVFTGCQGNITVNFSCYKWSVVGLAADRSIKQLVVGAKGNVLKNINSETAFTQIQITVENTDTPSGGYPPVIDWEKIKLQYK